ncbi:MAG: hypothetical protein P1U56_02400 [Saprospiraceae bacterium]|nr:hypothetical protein [Saprospiraceae bacterium]
MKKLILIHAVIEMIAGVLFIFRPDMILMVSDQEPSTLLLAKIYAILMFSFGAVCFFIYSIFEYSVVFKKIIMILMAFHLMVALQMYSGFDQGLVMNLGPFGLHIALAVLFGAGYMKEINSFK